MTQHDTLTELLQTLWELNRRITTLERVPTH